MYCFRHRQPGDDLNKILSVKDLLILLDVYMTATSTTHTLLKAITLSKSQETIANYIQLMWLEEMSALLSHCDPHFC